jgi:S-phase kinase-associated protein 1
MQKTLTLISSDNKKVQIDSKSAERSVLLRGLIQDYSEDSDIPMTDINGEILSKIVEWLIHWRDDEPKTIPKPLPSADFKDATEEWNVEWITKFSLEDNYELIVAANYMDIKSLLDLACARIAIEFKGKTIEEIREVFNIPVDMTDEEQQQIEEEYRQEKQKKMEEQRAQEEKQLKENK